VQGNLPNSALKQIRFVQADVFDPQFLDGLLWENDDPVAHKVEYDILVSNPPYISPSGFARDTSRSVRNWEPKLALVPYCRSLTSNCEGGDEFYPALLATATRVRSQFVVLEVGDMKQAKRVVSMARNSGMWKGVEVWKDWVDHRNSSESSLNIGDGSEATVWGEGNGRAVVCWSGEGETIFRPA
jgi:methylase of polypeptide subunit release factors